MSARLCDLAALVLPPVPATRCARRSSPRPTPAASRAAPWPCVQSRCSRPASCGCGERSTSQRTAGHCRAKATMTCGNAQLAGRVRAEVPGFGVGARVGEQALAEHQVAGERLQHVLPRPGRLRIADRHRLAARRPSAPGRESAGPRSSRRRRRRCRRARWRARCRRPRGSWPDSSPRRSRRRPWRRCTDRGRRGRRPRGSPARVSRLR